MLLINNENKIFIFLGVSNCESIYGCAFLLLARV